MKLLQRPENLHRSQTVQEYYIPIDKAITEERWGQYLWEILLLQGQVVLNGYPGADAEPVEVGSKFDRLASWSVHALSLSSSSFLTPFTALRLSDQCCLACSQTACPLWIKGDVLLSNMSCVARVWKVRNSYVIILRRQKATQESKVESENSGFHWATLLSGGTIGFNNRSCS